MQKENNHLHWKQKLEDAAGVGAGLPFNKGAAWKKLQPRLAGKPKRRKTAFYWMAAACLLPLLIWLLIPSHPSQNNLVKKNPQGSVTAKPAMDNDMPPPPQITVKKTTQPGIKKEKEKRIINLMEKDENNAKQSQTDADSSVQSSTAIALSYTDSSPISTPAIAATKKKLPVVHINELNEPAEAAPVLTHNFSTHPFPFL